MSQRRKRRGSGIDVAGAGPEASRSVDARRQATARARAVADLAAALGAAVSPELLDQALTHRSYAIENEGASDYERLELLGDSVLGFVVTAELFARHPDAPESSLARMRQAVVCTAALADVGRTLGVGDCLRLGKGERHTGGAQKPGILADAVEAIIAVLYLEASPEAVRAFVLGAFGPIMDTAAQLGPGLDWKSSLQERAGELGLPPPRYEVVADGPDNARVFEAVVWLGAEPLGRGSGTNKKSAEVVAAAEAYGALSDRSPVAASSPDA